MFHCILDMARDMWQRLSSSKRPLDNTTKAMLKVDFLDPVNTVLMKSIEDDCCSEEFLKKYFRNKNKSGAGVDVTVVITGRGEALVTFEDLSGECEQCECMQHCLIIIHPNKYTQVIIIIIIHWYYEYYYHYYFILFPFS